MVPAVSSQRPTRRDLRVPAQCMWRASRDPAVYDECQIITLVGDYFQHAAEVSTQRSTWFHLRVPAQCAVKGTIIANVTGSTSRGHAISSQLSVRRHLGAGHLRGRRFIGFLFIVRETFGMRGCPGIPVAGRQR